MRGVAANAITVLIVLGVVAAGLLLGAKARFEAPGPSAEDRLFTVERGATLADVSRALEAEGLIASSRLFRIGARYRGLDEALRYGEYETPARASMDEILALLTSGDVKQYPVTVAEGLTSRQVVELLRANPVLVGEIAEVPPEGSLAPDTYLVSRGQRRGELIARMRDLQGRRLDEAWAARADDIALDAPREALILASIIEKETGVAAERARISGVFHNRLRRGMRLQTDPAVIYGLSEGAGGLDRALTRRDLQTPTPWNTYLIAGLPPTPIANPGPEAIVAAVRPARTSELYFVADGSGGHAFAETLAEHNRNVAAWRAIERRRDNGN